MPVVPRIWNFVKILQLNQHFSWRTSTSSFPTDGRDTPDEPMTAAWKRLRQRLRLRIMPAFPSCNSRYLLTYSPSAGASVSKSDSSDGGYKLSAAGVPPVGRSSAVLPLFCYHLGPETFQLIC